LFQITNFYGTKQKKNPEHTKIDSSSLTSSWACRADEASAKANQETIGKLAEHMNSAKLELSVAEAEAPWKPP
jgi:hypothetical protein